MHFLHSPEIRFLSDLPNQEGFKFVGVLQDNRVDCYVKKDPQTGLHSVAGGAKFSDLIGWISKCK